MRYCGRLFLASWLSLPCLCAHAGVVPVQTTSVAPAAIQGALPGPPGSVQLQTNEVAVLLEHLQSQHVYLKHLENVRSAVERELSILRLMNECDRFGSACTGRGIVKKAAPAEPVSDQPVSGASAPSPRVPEPAPEKPSSSPVELPEVVAIYGNTASLFYRQRYVEVRRGDRLGPFRVKAVALDGIKIDGPPGVFSLLARWHFPALSPESPAVARQFSRF